MNIRTPAVLTIVRHGETSANIDGVWHGATDTPLTERGHRQASAVAEYLRAQPPAVALYASTLQRARHTAEAIGGAVGLDVEVDAALGEYDLGSWEGQTYRVLHEERRLWHHMRDDPDFAPHGGESPRQVTDRFLDALRRIDDRHRGERAIVVAHGGVLSMVMGALLDGGYANWRRVMDNCAVSELVLEPEPTLLCFNVTDHLDGL